MKAARKSGRDKGFTDEERAAMKERARVGRLTGRAGSSRKSPRCRKPSRPRHGRADPRDRQGQRASARAEALVRTRYATRGFSDDANLDEGAMWPTAFALTKLSAAEEARIAALVKKAVPDRRLY